MHMHAQQLQVYHISPPGVTWEQVEDMLVHSDNETNTRTTRGGAVIKQLKSMLSQTWI